MNITNFKIPLLITLITITTLNLDPGNTDQVQHTLKVWHNTFKWFMYTSNFCDN